MRTPGPPLFSIVALSLSVEASATAWSSFLRSSSVTFLASLCLETSSSSRARSASLRSRASFSLPTLDSNSLKRCLSPANSASSSMRPPEIASDWLS
eukprot:scaffold106223_cov26-Tisochrysis_lutea.AAC.6